MTHENPYYINAKICRDSNAPDSAFYYYNLAKNDFLKVSDSLGIGNCLVNMGVIQTQKGDFFGGIESSIEANKFLKKQNDSAYRRALSTNYNNIGLSFHFLKEFEKSSSNYIETLKYIDINEDRYLCYNNIGDLLISQGKFKLAKVYLTKAILADSAINYSKALNNLAKAKHLDDKNYNPLPEFNKALMIRQKMKDGDGLNSSYETLSSYYLDKDKQKSLEYAKKMLKEATYNNSPDDQITALKRIISLDSENYLQNFEKLDSINENVQTSRNKHKSQFAMVRYDVEQKNAQNQILESQSFKQIVGIAFLIIALISVFFWNENRKKNIRQEKEQEKELEVKNTQLKISKRVHDVVANGIYQVMTKIENQEHFNKDEALDELEFVYEKSRDISYEKDNPKNSEEEFKEKISGLIASFKNSSVETYVAGNENEIWNEMASSTGEELYQTIRELLVNMKKHSQADRVVFKFERINNFIKIQYTDNGIGIQGDLIYKNGLSSTVSRIESINGEITFDIKTEKGLKINISFPVS